MDVFLNLEYKLDTSWIRCILETQKRIQAARQSSLKIIDLACQGVARALGVKVCWIGVEGVWDRKSVFSHFADSCTIVARARAVRRSPGATPEAQGARLSGRAEGTRRGVD